MSRVLVAGCGYVGGVLAERLVAVGHEVWGLRRRPGSVPAGVTPIVADVTEPASLAALPGDLDAICYLVAADGFDEEAYRRAYVDGVRELLAAAAPRFLHVSSTGVYGQVDGAWVDEDSPVEPRHFSGRTLLAGEGLVREVGGVVLRLGGIYGPGREGPLRELRAGTARLPAHPVFTNRIHRDDAAAAIAHVLALPEPDPVYLVVDNEPADRREVLSWLATAMGLPAPPPAEAALAPPRGSKRCRNRRLLATGFTLRYPTFREGYRALLTGG